MFSLKPIFTIDRVTRKREKEEVFGEAPLAFLYTPFGAPLRFLITRIALLSKFYGYLQSRPSSKKKVKPFVETYGVAASEFEKPVDAFTSFNDFFIRKLKTGSRPIEGEVVMPADGRYHCFQNISKSDGHYVKGQKFSVAALLQDETLARRYEKGSMVVARLCPTDYHRFHFPCDGIPSKARQIDGHLHSVNPTALRHDINIFSHNKRMLTHLKSEQFGLVTIVEVGATCVGTIHQTYTAGKLVQAGDEKGFFSFGGSAMVVLFELGAILLDTDLLGENDEIRCLMGQSLGR